MSISELLRIPAAQPTDDGVPWHFGDPLGEQRGPRLIDRSDLDVYQMSGPDAVDLLERLLSQHFTDETTATMALNLDPQGRVLHAVNLILADGSVYLYGDPDMAGLMEYLERMKFWSEITFARTQLRVLSSLGNAPLPPVGTPVTLSGNFGWHTDYLLTPEQYAQCTESLIAGFPDAQYPLGGMTAYEAARVANMAAVVGVDTDEKTIPHEVPTFIAQAVHLNKGCYRGQETVSRVHNLGQAPRVFALVHLDGSAPTLPNTGDPITIGEGGRVVGRLGTIVQDADYGPIALALLKRSAIDRSPLVSGQCALAVDRSKIVLDQSPKAGRIAQQRLKSSQLKG